MNFKKLIFFFLFVFLFTNNAQVVSAQMRNRWRETSPSAVLNQQETQNSLQNQGEESKNQIREKIQEKIQNIKEKFLGKRAKIINGEIIAIEGQTLTVAKDGHNYTVKINEKTRLRRHFWGKSSLAEFSVGDKVNVWGKWADEEKTTIDALMIRNLSVMKRWGVFFGKVETKGENTFVINSLKRDKQTVYFTNQTKFINRRQQPISYNDVKEGNQVRIKGVWDKTLNKIIEVEQVKDFSLPPVAIPSPQQEE